MMFKDDERYKQEFWGLVPKLRLILCDADFYLKNLGHDLFITDLIRTADEQRYYYDLEVAKLIEEGKDPNLAISKKTSVHEFGRGGDGRPTKDENVNNVLMIYINDKYVYDITRPKLKTMIRHFGTAEHWHFQTL